MQGHWSMKLLNLSSIKYVEYFTQNKLTFCIRRCIDRRGELRLKPFIAIQTVFCGSLLGCCGTFSARNHTLIKTFSLEHNSVHNKLTFQIPHNNSLELRFDQELEVWCQVCRSDKFGTKINMIWIKDISKCCLELAGQLH